MMYVEQKKNKKVVYNEKSIGSSNTISTNYLFCNKSHFCGLKNMLYIFLSFLLSFDFLQFFFFHFWKMKIVQYNMRVHAKFSNNIFSMVTKLEFIILYIL